MPAPVIYARRIPDAWYGSVSVAILPSFSATLVRTSEFICISQGELAFWEVSVRTGWKLLREAAELKQRSQFQSYNTNLYCTNCSWGVGFFSMDND